MYIALILFAYFYIRHSIRAGRAESSQEMYLQLLYAMLAPLLFFLGVTIVALVGQPHEENIGMGILSFLVALLFLFGLSRLICFLASRPFFRGVGKVCLIYLGALGIIGLGCVAWNCLEEGSARAQNADPGVNSPTEEGSSSFFARALEDFNQSPKGMPLPEAVAAPVIPPHADEALRNLGHLAEGGDAQAQLRLAECYQKGEGLPLNQRHGAYWFHEAAKQGGAEAQYQLASLCYSGEGCQPSDEEAVRWSRLAAEQGHAAAQFFLACCYASGEGIPQSDAEAATWARRAAEQGDASAMHLLGACYERGKGVETSASEAERWYKKAEARLLELTSEQAALERFGIAMCYYRDGGLIVEQNFARAAEWLRPAVEQGLGKAQTFLGMCCVLESGDEKRIPEAMTWYRKAAEQNEVGGQFFLGVSCYLLGRHDEALSWLRRAAEQGHCCSQYLIASLCHYGEATLHNREEAVYWYRLLAEQGLAVAQYKLADCIRLGLGVARNQEEALHWCRLAASQGYEPAGQLLAELE